VRGVSRAAVGGTVLYAARTYADLGVDCRVVTSAAVADRDAIAAAFPAGVELSLLPSPVTTTFENVYDADQSRRQRAPALAPPLPFVQTALAGVDALHLGPLVPDDLDARWFEVECACRAVDVQGLTRRVVRDRVLPAADARLPLWWDHCRWLKGSVREWSLIASHARLPSPAPGHERLITRGIDGGDVETATGRHAWHASPPIEGCDPTGAGDVYFAAYLSARLRGEEPATAVATAARYTSDFLGAGRGVRPGSDPEWSLTRA
jgi:sugar/nucleoside kinase (ribokinase family)